MGPIGVPEMIFIFVLALLIFGPRKLPELGRTLGKAMTEFRRASNELRHAVEDEVRELDRQTSEMKKEVTTALSPDDGETPASNTIHPPDAVSSEPPRYEENPADGTPKPA